MLQYSGKRRGLVSPPARKLDGSIVCSRRKAPYQLSDEDLREGPRMEPIGQVDAAMLATVELGGKINVIPKAVIVTAEPNQTARRVRLIRKVTISPPLSQS